MKNMIVEKFECECDGFEGSPHFLSHEDVKQKHANQIYLAGKVYCSCRNPYGKSPDGAKYRIPDLCAQTGLLFTDSAGAGACHGTWDGSVYHDEDFLDIECRKRWCEMIFRTIDKCGAMLVYLDQVGSTGTITEMGYASGKGIPIFVYVRKPISKNDRCDFGQDYRFAVSLPSIQAVRWVTDVKVAAYMFRNDYAYYVQHGESEPPLKIWKVG